MLEGITRRIWEMTKDDDILKDAAAAAGFGLLLGQEGGSVPAKVAAALYGNSEEVLREAVSNNEVIAIYEGNVKLHFPIWQFAPRGGTLPGVKEVLGILAPRTRYDRLAPITFFLNKTARLGDLSPIEALRLGDGARVEAVKRLAIESLE